VSNLSKLETPHVWLPRANRDYEVVKEKHQRLFYEPARAINELVKEISKQNEGNAPFVDPDYGGVNSEVLLLLSDPGPKTQVFEAGSWMLSFQNDDPGAERICRITQEVGLNPNRCISWNAYPWYINKAPTTGQIHEGLAPLKALFDLLGSLRVVIAMGGNAQRSVELLRARHACVERATFLETVHSSSRGVTRGGRQKARVGEQQLADTFRTALSLL